MRKATQPGSCATCNTEIFSWHESPGGGRRMLANEEYRDISFKIRSALVSNNGSSMRIGFCSECAVKVGGTTFEEITENVRDGVRLDVTRMSFNSESEKLLCLGALLAREIDSFCGCPSEDIQRVHGEGGHACCAKKVVRRCCQHCFRMCTEGEDHAAVCEVIQKDLNTV